MEEHLYKIIWGAIVVAVGIIIHTFFGESIKRFWNRKLDKQGKKREIKDRVNNKTQARPTFRITQICDPESRFNYSSILKEQNPKQDLFLFEIDDNIRFPSSDQINRLKKQKKISIYVKMLGEFLTNIRNEKPGATTDNGSDNEFDNRRELIITNIPIPKYFYGCNSRDRKLLIISTSSIAQFFDSDGGPSLEDYIVRMLQRMSAFAVSPNLDPSMIHSDTSVGCLFDFTGLLSGIVDVVEKRYICPRCGAILVDDKTAQFYEQLDNWVKS